MKLLFAGRFENSCFHQHARALNPYRPESAQSY